MIELPDKPGPSGMEVFVIDRGFEQQGASTLRIDRPGGRCRVTMQYPPMRPDHSRRFIARLTRAKRQGIKIELPLSTPQGIPGSPVVDGAGQAGTVLNVRNLTPHYIAKEGFYLTIIRADGRAFLHLVSETVVASAGGTASLEIEPPLRAPLADGDSIEMRRPFVKGFIAGDGFGWAVPVHHLVAVSFTVEEYR